MKIASWNVNSLKVRLPHLLEWCAVAQPDVLALQEIKTENDKFPKQEIAALGYECVFSGQKTYNGVAILSRQPLHDVHTDIAGFEDPQRRVLAASVGDLRIVNLYVVNGQQVGSDKYSYKLNWLAKITSYLNAELKRYPKMIVLGDFNIAPEDRDVHDPELWRDQILCSVPERDALQHLLALGFKDSYRLFHQEAGQYSWWDYRQAAFRRNLGLRIDLVLVSNALLSNCLNASIDITPRRWERPSDHAPVMLELDHG